MVDTFEVTLPALTGDRPRRAWVYVPDFLDQEPETRLPVLYMFDGHNLFFDDTATYGKCWGLKEYLEDSETPLIVAAAECNHDPDNGRLSEYSPFSAELFDAGYVKGRGKKTMDWYVEEFKPYIDAHYPTLPDREHTFIGGSSMGGLMTLYALLRYNRVFSRGAALSPSIWFARDKLETMIRNARVGQDTVLYMDYGQRELFRREMADWYGRVTGMLMEKKVNVTSRIVPGGTHSEHSWEKQIPFFVNTLLYELDI